MERCSVVRLSELTGEAIPALIEGYRRERGLKRLWQERAWGEPDDRARHAIDEGNSVTLQLFIIQRDVNDLYNGVIARPQTAWQLHELLEGADPQQFTQKGFQQPDFIPYSGEYWQSIWGPQAVANPYSDDGQMPSPPHDGVTAADPSSLREWVTATLRTTALQGTGEHQSPDFDRGFIHGLTQVLHWLTEHARPAASNSSEQSPDDA